MLKGLRVIEELGSIDHRARKDPKPKKSVDFSDRYSGDSKDSGSKPR